MEGQVQQYVTVNIGSLWFDVPIGPLVTLLSQSSLRSTTPPSTEQDQEKEVFSTSMEELTCVLSKLAKKNMTSAKKVSSSGAMIPTLGSYVKGKDDEVGKSSYPLSKNKEKVEVFKEFEFPPLCIKEKVRWCINTIPSNLGKEVKS